MTKFDRVKLDDIYERMIDPAASVTEEEEEAFVASVFDPDNLASMTDEELMAIGGPEDLIETERLAIAGELTRRGIEADAPARWWQRDRAAIRADQEAIVRRWAEGR
jgi:hypothetical protein